MTREQVSEASGQSLSSSSFQGAFGTLRDLGLIDGKKDFTADAGLAATREQA
jgi:hypothetical protein